MSRGLGELQREIKDTLAFLWNHNQPTRFAHLRTCFLVRDGGEKGDTLEPIYELSMRRALKGLVDRGDVVKIGEGGPGDPHRYATIEDYASQFVRKGKKVLDATHAKEILLRHNAKVEKVMQRLRAR